MLTFIRLLKCRKYPYYRDKIKFTESPCLNCKVNGGTEPPPVIDVTVKRRKGG